MQIAIFSDIHANLPALEACLDSIYEHQPDVIYCLGDLVGYNIWPNEVVQLVRQHRIPTIKGNYDEGVGLNSNDCGCAYKTEEDRKRGEASIAYTNQIIGAEERAFLSALPSHLRLEWHAGGRSFTMLLVHGSPRKINEYLFEDREESSLVRMMQKAGADMLCFGHTHKPFYRKFTVQKEEKSRTLHAINTGSAGKPKDGNPQGGWVRIALQLENGIPDENGIKVDFVRFNYDVEKAAIAIEQSPLPDAFADMLRNGL